LNIVRALLPIVFLSHSFAANAQHPLILERLNTWNEASPQPSNDVLAAEISDAIADIYSTAGRCNATGLQIEDARSAAADRFAFTALVRGTIRNAWFVTTRIPDCDDAPVRFMMIQNTGGEFKTIRVNRGRSYAWESLIGDTLPLANIAAAAALKRAGEPCSVDSKGSLGVTRVASEGEDLGMDVYGVRYSGKWTEIWPIEICDRTVEVAIEFTADADGGAFTNMPGDQARILK
tara:strand:- start:19 stop:720 length:702 start_codon:yes stop_codon:yes gene_type:complete